MIEYKNMRKIILSLLIILSFLLIAILPNFFNICFPDGCSFNSNICNDSACINETAIQHLSERAQLLNATIEFRLFIIFAVILIFFSVIQKFREDEKFIVIKSYVKQKLLNSSIVKLFNYLIEVFSDGIVRPKIY